MLQAWSQRPLGSAFFAIEQEKINAALKDVFAPCLLHAGILYPTIVKSCTSRPIVIQLTRMPIVGRSQVCGLSEALPIAQESMQAVVLSHVLEFSDYAHHSLREADRVLQPEGRLLITGFNPLSVWGSYRLLRYFGQTKPWVGRYLSVSRLKDWLHLLGYEVLDVTYYFFRPPMTQLYALEKLAFLESWGMPVTKPLAAAYLISAKKCVSGLTSLRERWRLRRRVVSHFEASATRNS